MNSKKCPNFAHLSKDFPHTPSPTINNIQPEFKPGICPLPSSLSFCSFWLHINCQLFRPHPFLTHVSCLASSRRKFPWNYPSFVNIGRLWCFWTHCESISKMGEDGLLGWINRLEFVAFCGFSPLLLLLLMSRRVSFRRDFSWDLSVRLFLVNFWVYNNGMS